VIRLHRENGSKYCLGYLLSTEQYVLWLFTEWQYWRSGEVLEKQQEWLTQWFLKAMLLCLHKTRIRTWMKFLCYNQVSVKSGHWQAQTRMRTRIGISLKYTLHLHNSYHIPIYSSIRFQILTSILS